MDASINRTGCELNLIAAASVRGCYFAAGWAKCHEWKSAVHAACICQCGTVAAYHRSRDWL